MKRSRLYVGVDVGGTKILATLVRQDGQVLSRNRGQTPRGKSSRQTLSAILDLIQGLLREADIKAKSLRGVGIAIPGVVDPDKGYIAITPNMNLTGVKIVPLLQRHLGVPVALGNDANCGILGEAWLGAARCARSAVGVFVGTGIGGGILVNGKLFRGCRETAGEIGHLFMQKDGPLCGCGSRGCLEALASRTAIERDLRAAIAKGRKSVLTIMGGDLSVIRSSLLKKALKHDDALTKEVMTNAATYLGYACLSIRHLLDPELIVLGGGLIEACGKFMIPIVRKIMAADPLTGARKGGAVVESELGDDAVALGTVALAMEKVGKKPLKRAAKACP